MTRLSRTAVAAMLLAVASSSAAFAATRGAMVCLAPSAGTDAAVAAPDALSLEFYVDEGDPLKSWSRPLTRLQASLGADGTTGAYAVSGAAATGAIILFTGATPLTFKVLELKKTYETLGRNDEETAFMADAVPGVTCWSVTVEPPPQ